MTADTRRIWRRRDQTRADANTQFGISGLRFERQLRVAELYRQPLRGATFGTPCSQCNGGALPQPAYVVPDPLGCFYDWNQISVTSLNGFTGTVNLSLPNLPAGVTSLTAASISLPQAGSSSTPLKLLASTGASAGTTNVTLQGTSGALVHTVSLSLSIADQLPPCQ